MITGLYYWKWFIKPAMREASSHKRAFCPVSPINPKPTKQERLGYNDWRNP